MTDILVLEDLTVSDGNKQILSKLNLSLKDRGLTVVMGPMGAGKSTLTKFLGGLLNPDALNISFELAIYDSKSLGSGDRPLLVPQKVREKGDADSKFLLRVAEIEAITNTSGKLLCFDEPSSGLSNEDGAEIMRKLSQIAQEKAVLVISHNTEQAREFSDYIALIAGGRVVTFLPTAKFFDMKSDAYATHFLETGGLDVPFADTPIHYLSPDIRAIPDGFDESLGNPAIGSENWVVKDLLSLISLPVDAKGNLIRTSLAGLSPSRKVYHIHIEKVEVYGPNGDIEKRFEWSGTDNQPERNLPLAAKICHELDASISSGERITINTEFGQHSGAAILGAYLILKKFAPADALQFVAKKFPTLHLGMRLEQFLWDMDIEFLTGTGLE